MTRKTTFLEGWSWFKFNNSRLALGTNLKFYTSLSKGLKLKVRKFLGEFLRLYKLQRELILKEKTAFNSCDKVSDYQAPTVLLILYPELALHRSEQYIRVPLRPTAEFYFVIKINWIVLLIYWHFFSRTF